MTTAAIAFGGNLGNIPETFRRVLETLAAKPDVEVERVSRLYSTRPIGAQAGAAFVNAVAVVAVEFSPQELLAELQQLEADFGRERTHHWGPRTIDLDILSYGEQVIDSSSLTIPHPGCWYRRFVLDPWCDVAADWRHPLLGETVEELRNRLTARPLRVEVISGNLQEVQELRTVFECEFPHREIELISDAGSATSRRLPAIRFSFVESNALRTIWLGDLADPAALAVQVLRAALDLPVPMEDCAT